MDVIIIGAGAAGLCAADALTTAGHEVVVFEASDHLGGRVRSLEGFADVPIELGAEEVHGADNAVADAARTLGMETIHHLTTDDMLRLDGSLQSLDQAQLDGDVRRAFDTIDDLGNYRGENWTAEEFLTRSHFPRRAWHYLDSRLGVEHGTTLDRLAMRSFATYQRGWEARETNYTLRGRYLDLFQPLIARLEGKVRLNTPITAIEWDAEPQVRFQSGEGLAARAIIVTVPLTILRERLLHFSPRLPAEKIAAADAIGMDTGMKIILKFKHRFWDERMYFLHTDGFLPQFWNSCKGKSETAHVLTAFIGGSRAEKLDDMGVDPVRFAIEELDELFGAKVASRSFERGLIADWGADPWIRGLYSYPTTQTTEACREALARPLGGKIFFAGEATNTLGASGTVHGAMDTGWRAAAEVGETLRTAGN
ncbi:MAG TPA: NAD(P)/FAD-dependent oxidoreductase [Chthoniobacterales bacterium]|nr:NAD(P)/FAD-dependent oxidoreductase [Chthoniobacterales bacterium]